MHGCASALAGEEQGRFQHNVGESHHYTGHHEANQSAATIQYKTASSTAACVCRKLACIHHTHVI